MLRSMGKGLISFADAIDVVFEWLVKVIQLSPIRVDMGVFMILFAAQAFFLKTERGAIPYYAQQWNVSPDDLLLAMTFAIVIGAVILFSRKSFGALVIGAMPFIVYAFIVMGFGLSISNLGPVLSNFFIIWLVIKVFARYPIDEEAVADE